MPDISLPGGRVIRELEALLPSAACQAIGLGRWLRVRRSGDAALGARPSARLALYRSQQAAAESLRRELKRPAARRVPERDALTSLAQAGVELEAW